jgi:hypothetical protein
LRKARATLLNAAALLRALLAVDALCCFLSRAMDVLHPADAERADDFKHPEVGPNG